jgi:hypothetical protein
MAGRYGISFAKVLIERGDYEEAVRITSDDADCGKVEALFDRASARELMGEYSLSVADFETCIAQNLATKELDGFQLDDAYFGALVAAATATVDESRSSASAYFERYARVCPLGAHHAEVAIWNARIRGETKTLLDKTTEM